MTLEPEFFTTYSNIKSSEGSGKKIVRSDSERCVSAGRTFGGIGDCRTNGVSRPPVREALSALDREGLVVNFPRRGSFVVSFTVKDIEEVYSLRMILELEAVRRATPLFKTNQH